MIKRYRERKYIEAIQFTNTPDNINAIKSFVGVPVNVEYISYSSRDTQLRVVRDPLKAVIVPLGWCITKDEDGMLAACTPELLAEKYDEEIE